MTGIPLSIDRRVISRSLLAMVAAVVIVHVFVGVTDDLDLVGESLWRRLSNLDVENSVPTWLTAVLLLASALLSGLAGRVESLDDGDQVRYWWILAAGMLVLSVDEVASFHEVLAGPLRRALDLDGLFYYGWVVPALAALTILALYSPVSCDVSGVLPGPGSSGPGSCTWAGRWVWR